MRRVTKFAIGAAAAGGAWLFLALSLETWARVHFARFPDTPLTPAQEALFAFLRQGQLWAPWIALVVAVVLGAIAFLTRAWHRDEHAFVLTDEPDVVIDDVTAPAAYRHPRVWTVLVAGLFVPMLAGFVGLALVAAALGLASLLTGTLSWSVAGVDVELAMGTGGGLLLLIVGMEAALAYLTYRIAVRSPVPTRQRLALAPARLRWWAWPVLAVATLAVSGLALPVLGSLLGEPPDAVLTRLDALNDLSGGMILIAVAAVSILPGIAEELFFRGYVQSRLAERWSSATAITITAVLFALAHGYLYLVAILIPAGLWLGWVSWRTSSVLPSMFCHAVHNGVFVGAGFLVDEPQDVGVFVRWDAPTIAMVIGSAFILAVSIPLLARHGRVPDPDEPLPPPQESESAPPSAV